MQASIDATGSPLTDEALTAAKNADAVVLGAIGGPVRSISLRLSLGFSVSIITNRQRALEMGHRNSAARTRPSATAKRNGNLRQPPTLQLCLGEARRFLPIEGIHMPGR